ncbi:MAG: hypothetical protein U0610_28595, partial [bacterium]
FAVAAASAVVAATPAAAATVERAPLDIANDPTWRPLLWQRPPAIGPGTLTEPAGIDERLLARAIALAPELETMLAAPSATPDANPEKARAARLEAALAATTQVEVRALLATLLGRARLAATDLEAKDVEHAAFDVAREIGQARLASSAADTRCLLALATGRAASLAGLTSTASSAYRTSHCAGPAESAHAALAQGLLLVELGRKGEAESALASGELGALPKSDQALAIAARGDLELNRGEIGHAIDRYREAAARVPGELLPPALAIRLAEAARLTGDGADAARMLVRVRNRLTHDEKLTSWINLRLGTLALAAGQIGVAHTELGGAGDGDTATLRRIDARQAFAVSQHATRELLALADEYAALARSARDPQVEEEASFKAGWVALRAHDAERARQSFDAFRELHPHSALVIAASQGVDSALEELVVDMAGHGDPLELAQMLARDRTLLSSSAAGPRMWLLAGWALEALGLDPEAEALYRRTRSRLADVDRGCAEHLVARVAAIALRRGDTAEARRLTSGELDALALDRLAVWRPDPHSAPDCSTSVNAEIAPSPTLSIAAAMRAMDRDDCTSARGHVAEAGKLDDANAILVAAEIERRCGAEARAVALLTQAPNGAALAGDALAIALLSTDRFPESTEDQPIHPAPAAAGVWAEWARIRETDRTLAIELARARIQP